MTVRWEARSHAQIYREVHTQDGDLAGTVASWRWSAADLGELRARYESAFARLMAVSAGVSAEREELTTLNDDLRRALLPPVPPTEATNNFTGEGTTWLTAPNFAADDANRARRWKPSGG